MKPALKVTALLAVLAAVGLCPGCRRKGGSAVNVVGSTSIQPLASEWAREFRAIRPDVKVQVQGGGSTAGIQALANGIADIGTCSRDLTEEEAAQFHQTIVARDGLAVVVHPANPITALTTEQVRGLFSGAIPNWKTVGGKDAKVHVVTREEGSGTRETFMHLIMHAGGAKADVSRDAMVQQSNGAVRELVRNDPDAVGYMSLGLVGGQLKAVEIDGAKPTADSARSGQYKLIRPFLFVTKGTPRPEVKAFIDYVLSPEGQRLLEKEGLVSAK